MIREFVLSFAILILSRRLLVIFLRHSSTMKEKGSIIIRFFLHLSAFRVGILKYFHFFKETSRDAVNVYGSLIKGLSAISMNVTSDIFRQIHPTYWKWNLSWIRCSFQSNGCNKHTLFRSSGSSLQTPVTHLTWNFMQDQQIHPSRLFHVSEYEKSMHDACCTRLI